MKSEMDEIEIYLHVTIISYYIVMVWQKVVLITSNSTDIEDIPTEKKYTKKRSNNKLLGDFLTKIQ
jgi:hypothetical protein